MPYFNRVQMARHKLLLGGFLTQDELTQEQYELVTNPATKDSVILKLYDSLTGSHLSNRVQNPLDEGPWFCLNEGQSEEDDSQGGEDPIDEEVSEPTAPQTLTPCPT